MSDPIVMDDQCPITMRRCDRSCGTRCIRGDEVYALCPACEGLGVVSGNACSDCLSTGLRPR